MKNTINIVWLKRDLRLQDHEPLMLAEAANLPYIIVYLLEPSLINYPDTSLRHLQFQYHSILQLNKQLKGVNKEVIILYTEAIIAFQNIGNQYKIEHLFSYQESGINITYNRDKQVAFFCKENKIHWHQCQRDGIVRGINNRQGWDKQWFVTMHSPIIKNTYTNTEKVEFNNPFYLPTLLKEQLNDYPSQFQPAGENFAFKYLQTFVEDRIKNYSKHISKPLESRTSCGRISPYISWGNISIRQAYQYVYTNAKTNSNKFALSNFLTRLKWHCHFIQKFEVDCTYETDCINKGYELLEHTKNEAFIEAWKTGKTGFPLVDACMICLIKTGWLNFRMRAMLVSVFCHHLYQDWRLATQHLANLFLDYEPGIHYPQFQMQAGTTGINTIRMYNPVKQSKDHDPKGIFIKQWLPQLNLIPEEHIHEPHKMSQIEQQLYNVVIGKDYPLPIINIEEAGKEARKNIWSHRSNELVKTESKKIIKKHTRPKKNELQQR